MAAKYQLITELYRRTGKAVTGTRRRGRTFCRQPAAITSAALTSSFSYMPNAPMLLPLQGLKLGTGSLSVG